MDRTEDLDFELYAKYAKMFPNADTPNYWECGSWERTNAEMEIAIKSGVPWKSKNPADVLI